MARKKTTIIEEEPTEAQEIEEIQKKQLAKQVEGIDLPDDKPEPPKPEEKPKEPEKETKPDDDVEIDVDDFKDQLKEDLSREIRQDTANKINAALGIDSKATADQKDKYVEYAEKFEKENGRPPTWFELTPFIKDEVKADLQKEQEETKKAEDDRKAQIEEQTKAQNEAFDKYAVEQLNDLTEAGKLPPIQDVNDKNDWGVKVRQDLFTTMMEVNQGRIKDGKQPIWSIKEIYYEHFKMPSRQPAGADAPISAGRGGVAADTGDEVSYNEIHQARNLRDLIK